MRKLIFLSLLILGGAVVAPFVLPLKNGRPLLDPPAMPSVPKLPDLSSFEAAGGEAPQPVAVYRWRDEQGLLQLSHTPPPPGVPFETVAVNPAATNTLPGAAAPKPAAAPAASPDAIPSPLEAYSGAGRLVQDARNIQSVLEERKAQQERQLEAMDH